MARITVVLCIYVKRYDLWTCSFRVLIKINSPNFNKLEKIAENLSTLRNIFCPRSKSFIHVYYYLTRNKEQITYLLSVTWNDTKNEIYKRLKNKKVVSKGASLPLLDNTITIKFL